MTKHVIYIIYLLGLSAIFSCSKEETVEENIPVRRTIIAYITGDNNLSSNLNKDISEMVTGSTNLSSDCRIIVYSDCNNANPYMAEIKNGEKKIIYQYNNEIFSTSVDDMKNILQHIIDTYPSDEYALIMSGHGNGVIMEDTVANSDYIRLYAYGFDNTSKDIKYSNGGIWINVPSLATVFSNLKTKDGDRLHFEYIFFDCCCMQTAEIAYELRNYTDYIIAAASEVPGSGAPYNELVPVLGQDKSSVGASIVDKYISGASSYWKDLGCEGIAISVVKTNEMDKLLDITRKSLQELYDGSRLELNRYKSIYYYRGDESYDTPVFYDFKNIMLLNLSTASYQQWLEQYDKTVIYKFTPSPSSSKKNPWHSDIGINFYDFSVTEDKYGGMGFFFPYTPYDKTETKPTPIKSLNKTMFDYEWVRALGWHDMGW